MPASPSLAMVSMILSNTPARRRACVTWQSPSMLVTGANVAETQHCAEGGAAVFYAMIAVRIAF
jgi:hypothetical protein